MNTKAVLLGTTVVCASTLLFVASRRSKEYRETIGEIASAKSELVAIASRAGEAERLALIIDERVREIERLKDRMKAEEEAAMAPLVPALSGTDDELFGSWLGRIEGLSSYLSARAFLQIPELTHLTAKDWLEATISESLESEADFRATAAKLRFLAKQRVAPKISSALAAYIEDSGGELPTSVMQLRDKLDGSVAPEILKRYRMNPAGEVNGRYLGARFVLIEDQQVDSIWYSTFGFSPQNSIYMHVGPPDQSELTDAISKFEKDQGRAPEGGEELAPYIKSGTIKEHLDEMLRAMATPVR